MPNGIKRFTPFLKHAGHIKGSRWSRPEKFLHQSPNCGALKLPFYHAAFQLHFTIYQFLSTTVLSPPPFQLPPIPSFPLISPFSLFFPPYLLFNPAFPCSSPPLRLLVFSLYSVSIFYSIFLLPFGSSILVMLQMCICICVCVYVCCLINGTRKKL